MADCDCIPAPPLGWDKDRKIKGKSKGFAGREELLVMPVCRDNQNLNPFVKNSVDESMFFCKSSGENGSVVSLELFNLSGPALWMYAQLLEKFFQFWNCVRCFL